jgi:hypothetical protein
MAAAAVVLVLAVVVLAVLVRRSGMRRRENKRRMNLLLGRSRTSSAGWASANREPPEHGMRPIRATTQRTWTRREASGTRQKAAPAAMSPAMTHVVVVTIIFGPSCLVTSTEMPVALYRVAHVRLVLVTSTPSSPSSTVWGQI